MRLLPCGSADCWSHLLLTSLRSSFPGSFPCSLTFSQSNPKLPAVLRKVLTLLSAEFFCSDVRVMFLSESSGLSDLIPLTQMAMIAISTATIPMAASLSLRVLNRPVLCSSLFGDVVGIVHSLHSLGVLFMAILHWSSLSKTPRPSSVMIFWASALFLALFIGLVSNACGQMGSHWAMILIVAVLDL